VTVLTCSCQHALSYGSMYSNVYPHLPYIDRLCGVTVLIRSVIADPTGKHKYLMFIEGATTENRNCIGLYYSDDNDAIDWHPVHKHAILYPAEQSSGYWDNGAIGT
jgi:hypothetical protein